LVKADADTVGAKKIAGIPLSQFVKAEVELRTYWKIKPKWMLAGRVIGGIALGYGNSSTVPYAEQFFIGGTSSIRAFRIRTLGPGSFHSLKETYRADESGEIKFESNAEIRYDMSKYIKLAAFIDAGNIWLRKDAGDKPGGGLDKNDFFKEMAVGGGLGLRIDASVLVLSFDVAIPLRKPWYPEGERWVIHEIDFGSNFWRKQNLILNIGIGYPF
jgi:outer membrane protein insertion porin family